MTRYEIGFINKCAEYNIDAEKATILLKNSTLQKQAANPLAKLLVTAGKEIGKASKGVGKASKNVAKKVINGGKAVNNYRKALVDKVTPKSKLGRWIVRNGTLAYPYVEDLGIGPFQETTKDHQYSHNRAAVGRGVSYIISPLKAALTHLAYGVGKGTTKALPKIDEKYNKLKVRVADLASKYKDRLKDHLFNPENQGSIPHISGKVVDATADKAQQVVESVGEYLGKKVPTDYKAKTGTGKAVEAIDLLKTNPVLKQKLQAYKLPNFKYFPWPSLPPYGIGNADDADSQKSPTDFLKLLETK